MKKILIVAPFCSLKGEPKFNRFRYIAEMLSERYEVTLVTSKFRHYDKIFRPELDYSTAHYRVVLLEESGYQKNISLERVKSHSSFLRSFKAWFQPEEFDVVYSAYPLIGTNIYIGSKKNVGKFKLIIDVQDVWPEAITGALPIFKYLPDLLNPFFSLANRAYAQADFIVAVSQTYLERAQRYNNVKGSVIYIGTDHSMITQGDFQFNSGQTHFVYFGAVGKSYDLKTVILGFKKLEPSKHVLHIFGGGDGVEKLKKLASDNMHFHGFVPIEKMLSFAQKADVLLNPISASAKQSVTNKLSDIISLRKPVITSQVTEEVRALLSRNCDFFYTAGDVSSFLEAVHKFKDRQSALAMPDKDDRFDRKIAYRSLFDYVENI